MYLTCSRRGPPWDGSPEPSLFRRTALLSRPGVHGRLRRAVLRVILQRQCACVHSVTCSCVPAVAGPIHFFRPLSRTNWCGFVGIFGVIAIFGTCAGRLGREEGMGVGSRGSRSIEWSEDQKV